jgi:hypothetical protein
VNRNSQVQAQAQNLVYDQALANYNYLQSSQFCSESDDSWMFKAFDWQHKRRVMEREYWGAVGNTRAVATDRATNSTASASSSHPGNKNFFRTQVSFFFFFSISSPPHICLRLYCSFVAPFVA